MPLPTIAGVVRASAAGDCLGGGRWSNTWHYRRVDLGSASPAAIASLHAELLVFYTALFSTLYCTGTKLEKIDYTPLDGSSGAFSLPGGVDGADTVTNQLPPEVSPVITIRTGDRGRRSRGRIFLPPPSKGNVQSGRLTSTAIGIYTAATTALLAAAGPIGWELGVASYGKSVKLDRTVRPARRVETLWTAFFTVATAITMDDLLDVQRSRKR